jgi:hypothetical protein
MMNARRISYTDKCRREGALSAGRSAIRSGINRKTINAKISSLQFDLQIQRKYSHDVKDVFIAIQILFWRLLGKINKYSDVICFVGFICLIVFTVGLGVTKLVKSNVEFKRDDYGRHRSYIMYTVGGDESLWSIASELIEVNPEYRSVRAYVHDIASCNSNLYYDSELKYGQVIMIPVYVNTKEQVETLDKYQIDLYTYRDTDNEVFKIDGDR